MECSGGLKWLAVILSLAHVHILRVHVAENAVNVFHITAEAEKFRDASSPKPVKRLMTGQLKISTGIIKIITDFCR